MHISISGERHRFYIGNTHLVVFRLKMWRFMNYISHDCDHECANPTNDLIYMFNLKLVKRLRGQRFHEWVSWEPTPEDFELWEAHVQARKELDNARMLRRLTREIEADMFGLFEKEFEDE